MTQQKLTISNETQNYKELQKSTKNFWVKIILGTKRLRSVVGILEVQGEE